MCIQALDVDKDGNLYTDDLCAFRCLALQRGCNTIHLENHTTYYFNQWPHKHDFEGIQFSEFPLFESIFQINLHVYYLQEDGVTKPVYLSRTHHKETMYLNMYENHLSFISNINLYSQKCECDKCGKRFQQISFCERHRRHCKDSTQFKYPEGYFKYLTTLFNELSDAGVNVNSKDKYYP